MPEEQALPYTTTIAKPHMETSSLVVRRTVSPVKINAFLVSMEFITAELKSGTSRGNLVFIVI